MDVLLLLACAGPTSPADAGRADDTGADTGADTPAGSAGIETLTWNGADGLTATWAPAGGPVTLLIENAEGSLVQMAEVDADELTVTGLADGTYHAWLEPRSGGEGRRLRQHVGADRLTLITEVPLAGGGRTLDGEGTLLAVGGGDQGTGPAVLIVDVSTPETPVTRATIDDLGEVTDVEIADGILYVALDTTLHPDARYAVRIYDLADPDNPVEIGHVAAADDSAHTLAVGGDTLFLASTSHQCVAMWDVSDPGVPVRVGAWAPPPPAGVHDQTWVDGTLYTAWTQGMATVDVHDPSAPELLALEEATWADPFVHNLWPTADGHALAVSEEAVGGGVYIYDLADPAAPVLASTYQVSPTHSVHNVVVRDNLAFAAWYVDGIVVLDLADPYDPAVVGAYDTFTRGTEDPEDRPDGSQWPNVSGATHVWPFGDVVAVSDQMRGLLLFDYFPRTAVWGEPWSDR